MHRSEETGSRADLPEPVADDNALGAGRQGLDQGVGPMLHRSYAVRIVHSSMSPAALIDMVAAKLDQASPEMAVFRKTRGAGGPLRRGDEFVVRMPGPWDGPVRVIRRDATSFRLATLDGHLEAGEIEFRAEPAGDALHFVIESWARAGYRLSDLLYNRLRLAKEIQLNMWSHFCVRTAALAAGRPQGGVTIRTRWVAWSLHGEDLVRDRRVPRYPAPPCPGPGRSPLRSSAARPLDFQHLQRPVALPGRRLAQVTAGGTEPGEHVHERPAAGRLLGGDDAAGVIERASQRQLDEHIPAGLHGLHGRGSPGLAVAGRQLRRVLRTQALRRGGCRARHPR